jgi:hypothetical protein
MFFAEVPRVYQIRIDSLILPHHFSMRRRAAELGKIPIMLYTILFLRMMEASSL